MPFHTTNCTRSVKNITQSKTMPEKSTPYATFLQIKKMTAVLRNVLYYLDYKILKCL